MSLLLLFNQAGPVAIPSITIKAILEFGDQTSEGRIVRGVGVVWFELLKLIQADPNSIYAVDPFDMEELIAGAYRRAGFSTILTPRSGDKGRDVIASIEGTGRIRIIDQVKAYAPDRRVPANDVRALVGVLDLERNVSKGVITTTSTFAPGIYEDKAIQSLVPYRLELKPRDDLLTWLDGLQADASPAK